jgi:hypothetical protein
MLFRALLILVLATTPVAASQPDPASVQRFGAGYRYWQDGWIVVHIEGTPYERGVQHGRLLAPEIAGYLRCYSLILSNEAPGEGWRLARTLTDSVFLRGFDREFLEEMKGIADGASAAGARFGDRPIDLTDIAALNLWPELMTLDDANAARPTGLEGVVFPEAAPKPARPPQDDHCSAFAATGKATKDGHAIIGHITMFGLYPSDFYNVWLDIAPEHGHRLTMQSYPAGIYSGMDYYLNDAGIAMVETTINQTRFDPSGTSLASRARKAVQYADTIDAVVATLRDGNNGLYNNEWLLADMKTDEIAMYELATHAGKLWRSGKSEWFGGTDGFYWGCNNAKDLSVRLETIAATNDRPANMVWHPSDRDLKWVELYHANVGRMDEQFARTAFTTAPLCASSSVDAKFTTASLSKTTQSWCLFGPPLGRTWLPASPEWSLKFKEMRPLVSNPWTLLGPAASLPASALAADLLDPASGELVSAVTRSAAERDRVASAPPTAPVWHGTLLPATDADIWLASAFAEYETLVSRERGFIASNKAKCLCDTDADRVAVSLFAARARYLAGVRGGGDVALARVKATPAQASWYQIASGKGVLVLAELRRLIGDGAFVALMDEFGRAHAGQPVTSANFSAAASNAARRDLSAFFSYWLESTGLPRLELVEATAQVASPTQESPEDSRAWICRARIQQHGGPPLSSVEVTLEFDGGETTEIVNVDESGRFELRAAHEPARLIVDKYARTARAGNEADLTEFRGDLSHTLIVFGSLDDREGDTDAAEICQRAIRTSRFNVTVPIKSDADVSDSDLASNHLILIGRPAANAITARIASALPISFGPASFVVRSSTRAHADSAVIAAGVNPFNPRLTVVVEAGNSATSTYLHAADVAGAEPGCEVRVFDPSGKGTSLVMPDPKLVWSFASKASSSTRLGLDTLPK